MPTNSRFLKREHLRLRRDFARVLGGKCRAADALLVVYAARRQGEGLATGVAHEHGR